MTDDNLPLPPTDAEMAEWDAKMATLMANIPTAAEAGYVVTYLSEAEMAEAKAANLAAYLRDVAFRIEANANEAKLRTARRQRKAARPD